MPNPEDTVPRSTYNTRSGITWQQILQRPSWISSLTGGGVGADGADVALTIETNNGRIKRLASPIEPTDATNKAYVDQQVANANTGVADWDLLTDKPLFTEKFTMVDDNTNVKLITNLDMNSARIRNMSAPVNPQEAANKQYVDDGMDILDQKIDDEVADCLRDAKAYADTIKTIADAPDWNKVINKPSYLDDNGPISMDTQGVLIVDSNMSLKGNTLRDVADPALPTDAANKDYVDDQMSQAAKTAEVESLIAAASAQDRRWANITEKPTWVGKMDYIVTPTSGNTNGLQNNYIHVKTNVDMDGQTIAGLVDPIHASHAVPLRYLDTKISELRTSIGEGAGVLEHITRDSETLPTKIIVDLPVEFPATSRKRIRGLADFGTTEDHSYDAVNKRYVDAQIAAGGGTNPYADFLTVDGNELTIANLKTPTLAKNPSTKQYVDDLMKSTYTQIAQATRDLAGLLLFQAKVDFNATTSSGLPAIQHSSAMVTDASHRFDRLSAVKRSAGNIWINKITVKARAYKLVGNYTAPVPGVSDPFERLTSPIATAEQQLLYGFSNNEDMWIHEYTINGTDYGVAKMPISGVSTGDTIILILTPVIEAYALPTGQVHSFSNATDYRANPQGIYFTYALPPTEVPYFRRDTSAPTGLQNVQVDSSTASSIRVRGLNMITDNDSAVTISLHYNTVNSITNSTTISPIVPDSNGMYNIPGLSEKTNYYIWVSARDASNVDTGMVLITGANPAMTQGTPPTGLSGVTFSSATVNSITLGGLDGISDASYPVQFTVKCRLTSVATDAVAVQTQATITAAGSTPSITISGLSSDTRYYLWLEATDALGTMASATIHTDVVKTLPPYDVWDFIVTQAAVSLFNIELDRVQWNGTEALTSSMFTYVRPGATTSNSGTPTVDLLLDSTIDTPLKWTPTAAPVGSTLFTIRTSIVATDPIWTLSWWKPRNRPGLEIKKNGERFWLDPTLNLTGEAPAPYPVQYRDVWEFKATGPAGRDNAILTKLSWNQATTLTASMITTSQPSNPVSGGVGVLLDNNTGTNILWTNSQVVNATLLTVTTPPFTTATIWTMEWFRPNYRPALSIYKNGVKVYEDTYISTNIEPFPNPVQYITPDPDAIQYPTVTDVPVTATEQGAGGGIVNTTVQLSSNNTQTNVKGQEWSVQNMFDNQVGTYTTTWATNENPAMPVWVQADFINPITVKTYKLWATVGQFNTHAPKDFTIQGSNDSSFTTFTILDTKSNVTSWPLPLIDSASQQPTACISGTIATPASYRYYRLHITSPNNNLYTILSEWQLSTL